MNYPKNKIHNKFSVVTRTNLTDGQGKGEFGIKLFGTEGVIDIGWNTFTLRTLVRHNAPGYDGYDSYYSFSAKQKEEFKKWYAAKYGNSEVGYTMNKDVPYAAPDGYDDRLDHMLVFFNGVRTGSKIVEDASSGLRAAAPSIACNLSAELQKPILWDPEKMVIR